MYMYISKPFRVEILIPLNIPRVVINWYLSFRPTVLERTIFSRSKFFLHLFFLFFLRKRRPRGKERLWKNVCSKTLLPMFRKDDCCSVQSYYKLFVLRMQIQRIISIHYHVNTNARYREWRFHDIREHPSHILPRAPLHRERSTR